MCHGIAEKLIVWCERNHEFDEYGHIKAVYGMEVFLESLWKLVGILLVGSVTENRKMFFASVTFFSLLRGFAGGRHSKSSVICFLLMISIGLFPVYILKQLVIPNAVGVLLFVITFTLILIYAPCMSYVVHKTKKRKAQALILTAIYLVVFFLISDQGIRNAILFGTLAETLTLVKGGRKEYGEKEYS